MLAENHEDKVYQPNNPASKEDTKDTSNNLAFTKSGNDTKNPACYGDDCKNQTYNVRETEIVTTSFCHK